jgi:hypothetical protein
MDVEWRIEAVEAKDEGGGRRDGAKPVDSHASSLLPHPSPPLVRVSITHAMRLEVPVVRTAPGQWVVGELFVKAVASRTLAGLKRRIEEET